MNQIKDPPNDNYDFGEQYDYSVWGPDSEIVLTNVPWNNDYRDVVMFPSTNDLNTYINRQTPENVRLTGTYAKVSEPIKIDTPFNVANQYNYVRVYNPAQPLAHKTDTPRYFYYFIVDVRYVAPNTTQIVVQLDIWQTYIRQITFGRCYIERGHIGIANRDNFRNYGNDFLTVPEGLDTGDSYRPIISTGETQIILPQIGNASILVASTVDLTDPPGTQERPNFTTAPGGSFQGMPSGASYYIFTSIGDFRTFMRNFRGVPWVTQGIISITVIPNITRYYSMADLGPRLPIGAYYAPATPAYRAKSTPIRSWRDSTILRNYIPPRYRHLKKFFTFPYMALEITNFVGQSSIMKPELLNSDGITIKEEVSLLPPNQRISFWLDGYKAATSANSDPNADTVGTGYEHAVALGNLPSLALVNDGAILAMANTANSRAFGYQSADWSYQRALRSNEVSYDQASRSIGAAGELAGIGMNADAASTGIANQLSRDQNLLNAMAGTATGAAFGLVGGPAGSALGALAGSASGLTGTLANNMSIGASEAQLANRLAAGAASTGVSTGASSYIRDTNKGLADFAAKGDYENQIAGMNARTRDMQLTPPSIVGQQGGEVLGMLNFRFGYQVRVLMPDQATLNTIGEIWLRYGYSVHRYGFIPPSLMVMEKFTYWKLKETYIRAGRMPETFKQTIRGIMEKGVTVWKNPDDIGLIDTADNKVLDNVVIEGYLPPVTPTDPTPEPPVTKKKRKHNMLVFSSIDTNPASPGPVYALAGASPGLSGANWIETRDATRAADFLKATGQETPVGVTIVEFSELKADFMASIQTTEVGGEV
jgi:hypothetical protein